MFLEKKDLKNIIMLWRSLGYFDYANWLQDKSDGWKSKLDKKYYPFDL